MLLMLNNKENCYKCKMYFKTIIDIKIKDFEKINMKKTNNK